MLGDSEEYVLRALGFYREVRNDPESSLAPELIPMSDYEALDQLSEHVAFLPDPDLRPIIMTEISNAMRKAVDNKIPSHTKRDLPKVEEDDLTETFVRGTGPGGQKINKTSNRVVLVHNPTRLRVECQDTRSLHQNRKLARKRLQLKLDDYLHGSASRSNLEAQKEASKKQKAKQKSRARLRQKLLGRVEDE
jgi:hypothetical protein